ncbi:hypothetical protein PTNB85_10190 [Pyrenophora teres f. teres]|uniref:Uncharacterized protein n=1 Tax=Pyrenophora teres f. teres TaxID=97479 RepID=A0A6S6WH00_9PLEO|nr:hypothetical protein PTNB85_10190 [Pyrenophora teres f. teres]KAE8823128.1 hypothetical protein HRS9139_09537 [Pyrenophora teres f. teres]KAE8854303.1 hypothetical protein PTNB29_09659 [Pyrenophora teres f. teres]CAE7220750.1 hypothetical protein PTTW11_11362 [Pyrenophora teres f. teres]
MKTYVLGLLCMASLAVGKYNIPSNCVKHVTCRGGKALDCSIDHKAVCSSVSTYLPGNIDICTIGVPSSGSCRNGWCEHPIVKAGGIYYYDECYVLCCS